jgi:hypothetical protein
MAGRPKLRAMLHELEKRTRADFEDDSSTHLDYLCTWIQSGRTMVELAKEITKAGGVGDISPDMIRRQMVTAFPKEADRRIAAARTIGAHAQVDHARDIIDGADEFSREALAKAKMQADIRTWSASRANKAELGNGGDINISINHNELHLDSMRVRKLELDQLKRHRELEAAPHARLVSAESSAYTGVDDITDVIAEVCDDANSLDQLGLGM